MHFLAISLLSILAGTLLLAKFKKEAAGKLFVIISWFFIVVGFLLFIAFIAGGICKMSHHGCAGKNECRQEMMMRDCGPGMMGMPGGRCGPRGMHKVICIEKEECMPGDSAMKCSPNHMMKCDMKCDSTKMAGDKKCCPKK